MQKDCVIRICSTCKKPLPWSDTETGQMGWICCDDYYCSEFCLRESWDAGDLDKFEAHYSEDSDCYYTDWELEEIEE